MKTMINFDTLQYVETLTRSGVPVKQAKALAKVQKNVLAECLDTTLATKADVVEVKSELKADIHALDLRIGRVETEVKATRWMITAISAGVGALVFKAFF
jgi:hypothetical protein